MPRHTVTVLTGDSPITFECDEEKFVLLEALEQGLDLPYRCLRGWCLTCAARLVEGEVDQSASMRFYPEDAEAGFTLLCTARPQRDLKVIPNQKDAMRDHRVQRSLPAPRG